MNTIRKGRLGYNIFEKFLLKANWDIYVPITEDTKVDAVIIKGNKIYKVQIKTIITEHSYKKLPVRKINHNRNHYMINLYSETDIDYFIGVDLDTEDVYIVPSAITSQYTNSICISKLQEFKNNIAQLEH